jgi:OmpA-OmpF porin, OOP family
VPSLRFKKSGIGLLWTVAAAGIVLAPAALAQDQITAQLITPLNAASARKGDAVRARVLTPPALAGDTVQGQVTDAKASRGQSVLQFTMASLLHSGVSVPVSSTVTSIANSKGQAGQDEQGRPVQASNKTGADTASVRSRLGGLGGMLGGNPGTVASEASNLPGGNSNPTTSIHVVTQGPGLEFAVGTTLSLGVVSTGSQSIGDLPPNAGAGSDSATTTAAANRGGGGSGARQAAGGQADAASATGTAGGGDSGGQPEMKSIKMDFIPGEKTIFFDDFSDMAQDEPPPHWKVREGTVDLRTGGGVRELYSKDNVQLTSPSFVIPKNFTFELEFTGEGETAWAFQNKEGSEMIHVLVRGEPDGHTVNTTITAAGNELGAGTIQADNSKPIRFALWAQQGRVRAYVNGQRLVDANQVEFEPMTHILGRISGYRPNAVRSVRVAESAPDFSSVISNTGKYVTHGIHFDTDSDRLKPESGAVLKQVAAGMDKNPNLKLEIDGYTDTVGNADHNLDLSKRRAQAVMSVLVSQFGVDAGRLSVNGFGPEKPIASNDTPDGRAENRRVEFIKK